MYSTWCCTSLMCSVEPLYISMYSAGRRASLCRVHEPKRDVKLNEASRKWRKVNSKHRGVPKSDLGWFHTVETKLSSSQVCKSVMVHRNTSQDHIISSFLSFLSTTMPFLPLPLFTFLVPSNTLHPSQPSNHCFTHHCHCYCHHHLLIWSSCPRSPCLICAHHHAVRCVRALGLACTLFWTLRALTFLGKVSQPLRW
jgi:hypothetical protein